MCFASCSIITKVDTNARDDYGWTALIYSCMSRNINVVREFLNCDKVDVNARDKRGNTALAYASMCCYIDVVHELLNCSKVDVNARAEDGSTALFFACEIGSVAMVREFLNHLKVDCLIASTSNSMRKSLTSNTVDVNVKDWKGRTSLYMASRNDHWEVVCELMKHEEVDQNVQGPLGFTPLM
ncbi:hypothetical protein MHU86_1415 [Fragilaria crotonensis]|nr:hypothetical protein MHU86_1415 [Fragilaria crotonensis]